MKRIIKTIQPTLYRTLGQLSESEKISYWLEKLFNQKKGRVVLDEGTQAQVSLQQRSPVIQIDEQSPEAKGLEEAVTSRAGKVEKNRQAVEDMVNNSNRILLKSSSVFPWDFFPSSIIVEETRVTIIHRQLFSSQVYSVDIKNISNIFLNTSILFSQLVIVSDTFAENQIIVDRLWKKEAIFVRRILEGLRMFIEKDIDTTSYKTEELINKLRELSTTKIVL